MWPAGRRSHWLVREPNGAGDRLPVGAELPVEDLPVPLVVVYPGDMDAPLPVDTDGWEGGPGGGVAHLRLELRLAPQIHLSVVYLEVPVPVVGVDVSIR